MSKTTITTSDPLRRGSLIAINGEGPLRVVATSGSGPFTSTVRRVPGWRIWLSQEWGKAWGLVAGPWRRWLASRCEPDAPGVRCWRRAAHGDYYCARHVLSADEWEVRR